VCALNTGCIRPVTALSSEASAASGPVPSALADSSAAACGMPPLLQQAAACGAPCLHVSDCDLAAGPRGALVRGSTRKQTERCAHTNVGDMHAPTEHALDGEQLGSQLKELLFRGAHAHRR